MDKKYKRVFVRDNYVSNNLGENEAEVSVDYVYMIIPEEYVCIYHKLLICLVDYGEEALNDCKAACKGQNLYIIQCWNMFQSALACHALGLLDKADLLIKYIDAQLDIIFKGIKNDVYSGGGTYPVLPDGSMEVRVSCKDNLPSFFINKDVENAYRNYFNKNNENGVYTDEENIIED